MKTPEKIKNGLECCTAPMLAHDDCPYKADRNPFDVICKDRVMEDALALIHQLESQLVEANKTSDDLKARLAEYEKPLEPMTLEEAKGLKGVWIEDDGCYWGDEEPTAHPALYLARVNWHLMAFISDDYMEEEELTYFEEREYGKTWRCWSRRPTDKEIKAAKWDG